MIDKFLIIGIDYKTSSLEERESFVLKIKPHKIIDELKHVNLIKEGLMLNTCLRIEFCVETTGENRGDILEILSEFREKLHIKNGLNAVRYLFKVTCGLDSVIAGEDQILAQIKKSYFDFLERRTESPMIKTIFNHAISVGKRFRHFTGVACIPLSLENIAVKFIEETFLLTKDEKILIIGTGDLNRQILRILMKKGFRNITVTNRTHHKAVNFSEEYGLRGIDFDERYKEIAASDIVISATNAPHYILHFKEIEHYISDGRKRVFIDLAVPRDIEPEITKLGKSEIYNMDNLLSRHKENLAERKGICENYTYLIEEQMVKIEKWALREDI